MTLRRTRYAVAAAALSFSASLANAQMPIPQDADTTCTVDEKTVASWFGGTITKNGAVSPADSLNFTTNYGNPDVCDFYIWGHQMFLWLTSQSDGGIVLEGPTIYTLNNDGVPSNNAGLKTQLRKGKTDNIGAIDQAGSSGVLMSQPGGADKASSLVYYGVHINDLYAYFKTGKAAKAAVLEDINDFPFNADDNTALTKYIGEAFPDADPADPNSLVMELKTSWVDASTLNNPEEFVLIEGEVMNFDTSNPNIWTPASTPSKTIQLALVGMHVVGTVQDHPEMIWISFEHVLNTPNETYSYTDTSQNTKTVKFDPTGDYIFANATTSSTFNQQCMIACGSSIVAGSDKKKVCTTPPTPDPVCDGGIVPSNTSRENPWGSTSSADNAVSNNTLLISLNNSVIGLLADGDVRANYFNLGGIWTTTPDGGGNAPIPTFDGKYDEELRGSKTLANSTMETYVQETHCFSCHALNKETDPGIDISHIFNGFLQPLPTGN